ncbi:MAG: multicopper oxidase domain-containing protein [Chloroflexota bacterium]
MTDKFIPRRFSRRDFLKLGTRGTLAAALGGGVLSAMARHNLSYAAPVWPETASGVALPPARPAAATLNLRLAATDGYISLPGRRIFPTPNNTGGDPFAIPDDHGGLYVFGFVNVPLSDTLEQAINRVKGKVQGPAPIIDVTENDTLYITLLNTGLVGRPDLDDSHTIHWHGFDNPNAVFDGVPEVSIGVPPAREFPYFFRPRVPGTYIYHCHFEDSEHVQMGMDGIVFIRPAGAPNQAYADISTAFDREYTLLFNEIDTTPHDGLINVQEFVWSNYDPNYWVINSRSYPDTILTNDDIVGTDLEGRQPISSLIQANEGETVLLRMANLGYEQQAMQMLGIRITVIGHDATYLGPLVYQTDSIYIGPGEARDVLFEAPAYNGSLPGGSDSNGPYNVYWFKNHHPQRLVNGAGENDNLGNSGPVEDIDGNPVALGGQVTQVRVYGAGTLGPQTSPNQTFGRTRP